MLKGPHSWVFCSWLTDACTNRGSTQAIRFPRSWNFASPVGTKIHFDGYLNGVLVAKWDEANLFSWSIAIWTFYLRNPAHCTYNLARTKAKNKNKNAANNERTCINLWYRTKSQLTYGFRELVRVCSSIIWIKPALYLCYQEPATEKSHHLSN